MHGFCWHLAVAAWWTPFPFCQIKCFPKYFSPTRPPPGFSPCLEWLSQLNLPAAVLALFQILLPPPQRHFHFPHSLFLWTWKHLVCICVQPRLQPCLLLRFAAPTSLAVSVPTDSADSLRLCAFAPAVAPTEVRLAPPHHLPFQIQLSITSSRKHPQPSQPLTLPLEGLPRCFHGTVKIPLSWTDSLCIVRCSSERAPEKGAQGGGKALEGLVHLFLACQFPS